VIDHIFIVLFDIIFGANSDKNIYNNKFIGRENINIFLRIVGVRRKIIGLNKGNILDSHSHRVSMSSTVFNVEDFALFDQIIHNTSSFTNAYRTKNVFQEKLNWEKGRYGSFANCYTTESVSNNNRELVG